MTVGRLDRRTALALAAGLLFILLLRFGVFSDRQLSVEAATDSIPLAEKRLERLRRLAATLPAKETAFREVSSALAAREKGMIRADTAAQAQAQLLEIIRRIAKTEGLDVRGAEELRVRPLAEDYGEVSVAVTFNCRIEQLVNFLAALSNEPELLATSDIRVSSTAGKDKAVGVRLGLSGVVPRKLVPEKKAAVSF